MVVGAEGGAPPVVLLVVALDVDGTPDKGKGEKGVGGERV